VVAGANERGVALTETKEFKNQPGRGVSGGVDGHAVVAGNQAHLQASGIDATPFATEVDKLGKLGHAHVLIAVDGKLAGLLDLADTVKTDAASALG
jgi:Cu+-exporting ATPase